MSGTQGQDADGNLAEFLRMLSPAPPQPTPGSTGPSSAAPGGSLLGDAWRDLNARPGQSPLGQRNPLIDNPVGTQSLSEQSLANPAPGGFSPVVGELGGVPATQRTLDSWHQGQLAALNFSPANIMAGPNALTANMGKLTRAADLEKAGATPHDIWQQTQWFRGADGGWRFEIPDTDAKISAKIPRLSSTSPDQNAQPFISATGLSGKTLGQVVLHPNLYAAYPDLAKTPMQTVGGQEAAAGLRGAIYPDGSLGLATARQDEAISTALHEIQHKIQDKEGFARGGMPHEFYPPGHEDYYNALKNTVNNFETDYLRQRGLDPISVRIALEYQGTPQLTDYLKNVLDEARKAVGSDQLTWHSENLVRLGKLQGITDNAFQKYRSLMGETESRNVQRRLANDDYSVFPRSTESIPEEQQIAAFQGKPVPRIGGP
jgi:hypothetical protein